MTKARVPEREEVDELQGEVVYMAYVVETYGEVYAPVLDRLMAELDALRFRETPRDRARRVLNTYTREGALKAIR